MISRTHKQMMRGYNKYNHCLSRKGYAGLMEELCSEAGLSEDQIDRSVTWIRGKRKKSGGYNPDVQKIVDSLLKAIGGKYGKCSSSDGKQDILAKALGKDPINGNMQGTGKFVTKSMYFNTPSNFDLMDSERKKFEEWLTKHDVAIEGLWTAMRNMSIHSDVGSSNFPMEGQVHMNADIL